MAPISTAKELAVTTLEGLYNNEAASSAGSLYEGHAQIFSAAIH